MARTQTKPEGVLESPQDTFDKARELMDYWVERDNRMDIAWKLYTAEDEEQNQRAAEEWGSYKTTQPKVLGNAVASLVSREEVVYRVPTDTMAQGERRQTSSLERFLKGCRRECDLILRQSMQGSLSSASGRTIAIRGWYGAARIIVQKPKEPGGSPIDFALWDPRDVYPEPSSGRARRIIHVYDTTVSALKDDAAIDWPEDAALEATDTVSVYDDWVCVNNEVWNGVAASNMGKRPDGFWLLEPRRVPKLRHLPIIMGPVSGDVISPRTDGTYSKQAVMGKDAFHLMGDHYAQFNDMMAELAFNLRQNVRGGLIIYAPDGREITIDRRTGLNTHLRPGESVTTVPQTNTTPDFSLFLGQIGREIEMGGLPTPILQGMAAGASGYLYNQMMHTALMVLDPFIQARKDFEEQLALEFLEQFQLRKMSNVTLYARDQKGTLLQESFSYPQLRDTYYVEVDVKTGLPEDENAKAQRAVMLMQAGVSPYTIWEMLGIADVDEEESRNLRALAMRERPIALLRIVDALIRDGREAEAITVLRYFVMEQQALFGGGLGEMGGAGPGAMGGAPVAPAPPMPGQMSPEFLPPEQAGIPPQEFQQAAPGAMPGVPPIM